MGAQCCAPLQDYDLTLPCSVTVNQLQSFMDEKLTNLKILDCTQKLTRYDDSKDCFMKQSIPGSMFLDMRVLQNEPNSTSKNTLPSLPYFISHMEILGIKTSDKIVLYAQNRKSIPFAHRARYIFKAFNHNDVLLLDGSLENWIDVGYSTASGLILHNVNPKRSAYKYKPNQTILASLQDVIFSISDNFDGIQILDARKMNFYEKSMKNPPKGRTIGKIPTAIHFDAFECFETDGTLKNRVEITSLYQIKGLDFNYPIIVYCLSSVLASVHFNILTSLGVKRIKLYENSYKEWQKEPITISLESFQFTQIFLTSIANL